MVFLYWKCYTFGLRFVTVLFYTKHIKENIDYDSLLLAHPYDQEMVEGKSMT